MKSRPHKNGLARGLAGTGGPRSTKQPAQGGLASHQPSGFGTQGHDPVLDVTSAAVEVAKEKVDAGGDAMSQAAHLNSLARGTGAAADVPVPAMPKAKLCWAQASRGQLDPAATDCKVDLKPAF